MCVPPARRLQPRRCHGARLFERQIARRLRTGRWVRVLPRVYGIVGGARQRSTHRGWRPRCGPATARLAAYGTAAALWDFDGVRASASSSGFPRRDPRLTSSRRPPRNSTRSRRPDHARGHPDHHADPDADRPVGPTRGRPAPRHDGGPVPSQARPSRSPRGSARHVRTRGDPARPTRGAARHLREGARSAGVGARGEGLATIERSRLPLPARQHWVLAVAGAIGSTSRGRQQRVGLECDGCVHDGPEHFERDELRRAQLAAVHWRIVPVTWRQLTSGPRSVVSRIEHAVAPSGRFIDGSVTTVVTRSTVNRQAGAESGEFGVRGGGCTDGLAPGLPDVGRSSPSRSGTSAPARVATVAAVAAAKRLEVVTALEEQHEPAGRGRELAHARARQRVVAGARARGRRADRRGARRSRRRRAPRSGRSASTRRRDDARRRAASATSPVAPAGSGKFDRRARRARARRRRRPARCPGSSGH